MTNSNYIWEINLAELLNTDPLNFNHQQIQEHFHLLTYYHAMRITAQNLIAQVNETNFSLTFEKLMTIDAKCRVLLDLISLYLDDFITQEHLIYSMERDYLLAHDDLFIFKPDPYEKYSLCHKITSKN